MQFLKTNLFPANGNDFRAFFLLGKTIVEIRPNLVFNFKKYSCKGKLINGRGKGFSAGGNHFFSPFFETPVSFFPSCANQFSG